VVRQHTTWRVSPAPSTTWRSVEALYCAGTEWPAPEQIC
jgi:hypothetical protein